MIIEKDKIRERPRVHFLCRCITKFGEQRRLVQLTGTEGLLSATLMNWFKTLLFPAQRFGNLIFTQLSLISCNDTTVCIFQTYKHSRRDNGFCRWKI
jgi:hypothetical protein